MPTSWHWAQKLLDKHGIRHATVNARILALSVWCANDAIGCQWIDITDWTPSRIKRWLGY